MLIGRKLGYLIKIKCIITEISDEKSAITLLKDIFDLNNCWMRGEKNNRWLFCCPKKIALHGVSRMMIWGYKKLPDTSKEQVYD